MASHWLDNDYPRREYIFPDKESAAAFVGALKASGVRTTKVSVRKTRGWKTYSAAISYWSTADLFAGSTHYAPACPRYRDIAASLPANR